MLQALDLSSQHLFGPKPLAALCDAAAAGALPLLAQLDLKFNPLTDAAAGALPGLLSPGTAWQALSPPFLLSRSHVLRPAHFSHPATRYSLPASRYSLLTTRYALLTSCRKSRYTAACSAVPPQTR